MDPKTSSQPSPADDEQDPDGQGPRPISAPDAPVDHERQPGVPPPSADEDYDDAQDQVGAESFPASDPPSSW